MIPVKTNMSEVDHLPGEEVQFTIGDPRWVMRSLADLYSNRELAVVREYSTNARDAIVMAGKDDPIVVTLPTAMNPYFTVTDTGVGMSEQVLKERYTKFGDSDKRDTNDANGMLGFGCKSAVAYTNTFTVTSVFNGRKTVAVITRKEDYAIVLKVVANVATIEGNGTRIEIPVSNPLAFSQVAKDFYRFWKPGTVLVDGAEPSWAVGEKIADDLFMYPREGISYVVMGNVPYRINNPDALFPRGMKRISFVAYVPNGYVEFTPNREDLKYSEYTKKNLHKIIDDFVATALEQAKKEIGGAKTHWEAYAEWRKWHDIVGIENVEDLTFKGDKFEQFFEIKGMMYNSSYARGNASRIYNDRYSVPEMNHTIIITGFTPQLAAAHKKKARDWSALKQIRATKFIFTEAAKFSNKWVDPVRVVSWDQMKIDVPNVRKPRAAGGSVNWGRKAGTFDLLTTANGWKGEQEIPAGKKLYQISVQELKRYNYTLDAMKASGEDLTVVIVPANRKQKFDRNYKAGNILDYLRAKVKFDGKSLVSEDAKKIMSLSYEEENLLKRLDPAKIDDPEVHKVIELTKGDRSVLMKEYQKHYQMAHWLGVGQKFVRFEARRSESPVKTRYPLIDEYKLRQHPQQVYFYINALYKARKDGLNV